MFRLHSEECFRETEDFRYILYKAHLCQVGDGCGFAVFHSF